MAIPRWLEMLISESTPVEQRFKRYVVMSICTSCMTRVFTGVDSYPYGRDVLIEPEPLNALGEAWARSAGIITYRLFGNMPSKLEIESRLPWDMLNTPPGHITPTGLTIRVVRKHVCSLSTPPAYMERFNGSGDPESMGA